MEEVVVGVAVAGGGRIGGPDGADGRGVPTGDGGGGPFGLDRRTGGPQSSSGELLLLASEMSLLSDGQLARLARLLGVRVLALRLAFAFGSSVDANLPARKIPRPALGAMRRRSSRPRGSAQTALNRDSTGRTG